MDFLLANKAEASELYTMERMRKLETLQELDVILENGFRILGEMFARDTFNAYRQAVNIPLRIRLDGFSFSKSQRQLLKKNKAIYDVLIDTAAWNVAKTQLFMQHQSERFDFVSSPWMFLPLNLANTPTPCMSFDVINKETAILECCSFVHLGEKSISGTMCFYNWEAKQHSLGNFSLLLELEYAIAEGFDYYYLSNVMSKPSIFDYKLNFNQLEAYSWVSQTWVPIPRVFPRNWRDIVEVMETEDGVGISDWLLKDN